MTIVSIYLHSILDKSRRRSPFVFVFAVLNSVDSIASSHRSNHSNPLRNYSCIYLPIVTVKQTSLSYLCVDAATLLAWMLKWSDAKGV